MSFSKICMQTTLSTASLLAFLFLSQVCPNAFGQEPAGTDRDGIVSNVKWSEDGKSFEYSAIGKRFRFDLETQKKTEIKSEGQAEGNAGQRPRTRGRRGGRSRYGNTGKYIGRPTRGRQYTQVESPDEKWTAEYKDWNLVLVNKESKEVVPVTTEGNEQVHYGTASWVYGEELGQRQAMWWTADSKKILYYRFDDSNVKTVLPGARLERDWHRNLSGVLPEGR